MSQDEKPKVGRPTKYTDEMPKKLLEFFEVPLKVTEIEEVASKGEVVSLTKQVPNTFPTFENFAVKERLSDSTLRLWRDTHPEFSLAYEICKKIQKNFIIQHGLIGSYNSAFAKFVAVNVTDLKDSTHQEIEQHKIQINIDSDDANL